MEDLIRRSEAIDALIECGDWYSDNDEAGRGVNQCIGVIHDLPSAEPEVKEISYTDCANAMLKMWVDDVLTDGEYNRIMDKLNAHEMEKRTKNG